MLVGLEIVIFGVSCAFCSRSMELGMVRDIYVDIDFWYRPQLAEGHKGVKSKMAAKMAAISYKPLISGTKLLREMILVSRTRFSGSRNPLLTSKWAYNTYLINYSRWPPKWPPKYTEAHISGTRHLRTMILVSRTMFSWPRISFMAIKLLSEALFIMHLQQDSNQNSHSMNIVQEVH